MWALWALLSSSECFGIHIFSRIKYCVCLFGSGAYFGSSQINKNNFKFRLSAAKPRISISSEDGSDDEADKNLTEEESSKFY